MTRAFSCCAVRLTAALFAVLTLGNASLLLAQKTTYGEDPVPHATEMYEHWHPYGSDPVPRNRIDNQGYVRAYGMDPVPGQPLNDNLPLRIRSALPDSVLPIQEVEVLTGESKDGR